MVTLATPKTNGGTAPRPRRPRLTRAAWGCLIALCALFLLLLWRCPYGFDWSDEAYQSAVPYRLAMGDRPFIDTWEVHQLSGMIALPFLRVFLLFSGGATDGMLLFFRYLGVSIQFLVALYAFFVLRRAHGDVPAALCAGLVLMHSHYAMNNFFYNSMTLLFLLLSFLLLMDAACVRSGGAGRGETVRTALSGAAYALSVLAYPYVVLTLPVWLLYWWRRVRRAEDRKPEKRALFVWLGGVLAPALLFAAFVLVRCPLRELWQNIGGMLHDPDHQSESLVHVMGYYFNAIRVLYGPAAYGAAALCAYGAATCLVKRAAVQRRMRTLGLFFAAAVVLCELVWIVPYDYPAYHKITMAAAGLAMVAPGVYFLAGRRKSPLLWLYFLGCALSVAVQIGSNTRVRASLGMLLPASVASALYLVDTVRAAACGARLRRALTAAATAAVAAMLLLTAGLRLTAVYRDEPIPKLTARIASGPAKGLRTTPESADKLAVLSAAVCDNAPESGALLMTNLMPIGYLLTDLPPATPSCYNMTMDAAWLWDYYALHPARKPSYVFAAAEGYGESNDLSLQGAAETFGADGAYRAVQTPAGTAYILD